MFVSFSDKEYEELLGKESLVFTNIDSNNKYKAELIIIDQHYADIEEIATLKCKMSKRFLSYSDIQLTQPEALNNLQIKQALLRRLLDEFVKEGELYPSVERLYVFTKEPLLHELMLERGFSISKHSNKEKGLFGVLDVK